jgi:hypothetical protein
MPIQPPPQLKASMFGRMPVGGPKLQKPGGGLPPPKGPSGVRIEHRIGIQTPPDVIWELLYDIDHWSDWNPLYSQASGSIHIGDTLNLTVVLPGMKPQAVRATVLEWVPNEQLHYRTSGLGGLVKGTRYVEIEQLAPESCIVSNGEITGGLLGPTVARQIGGKIYKGLRLANEALKEQAEARWRVRQGK